MILDERLEFCDATVASGTGVSQLIGDVADKGAVTRDMGDGEPMFLVISVDTAYPIAGTSIEFQLRSSTLAALTGGSPDTTHLSTGAISTAAIIPAGTTYVFALPIGTVYQRYIGMWLVTVGAVTTGKVNAFLTHDIARYRAYADASN